MAGIALHNPETTCQQTESDRQAAIQADTLANQRREWLLVLMERNAQLQAAQQRIATLERENEALRAQLADRA